jgi:VIT1/CCC1 family predicted Fe2+/Mn2+ transporter
VELVKAVIAPTRSLSTVIGDIVANLEAIVRTELRLATSEVQDHVTGLKAAALVTIIGAIAGALSALWLLVAAFYGLSQWLTGWASALCLAALMAVVATGALVVGTRRLRRLNPVNGQTPHGD